MIVSSNSVRIAAPVATVWRALTEPDLVKGWQYGSDLLTGWTPGSPLRFVTEWEGTTVEQWGTVLDVDPPRSLRYSLFAPRPDLDDVPENYFFMTYALASVAGGTVVTITKEDPRPGATEEAPDPTAETPVLGMLRTVAEGL